MKHAVLVPRGGVADGHSLWPSRDVNSPRRELHGVDISEFLAGRIASKLVVNHAGQSAHIDEWAVSQAMVG